MTFFFIECNFFNFVSLFSLVDNVMTLREKGKVVKLLFGKAALREKGCFFC